MKWAILTTGLLVVLDLFGMFKPGGAWLLLFASYDLAICSLLVALIAKPEDNLKPWF